MAVPQLKSKAFSELGGKRLIPPTLYEKQNYETTVENPTRYAINRTPNLADSTAHLADSDTFDLVSLRQYHIFTP